MEQITISKDVIIEKPDQQVARAAKKKWDAIAKPLDGLGKLEDLVCKMAAIQGTTEVSLEKAAVIAMCADNGIVEEGVTQAGQEVTGIVAVDMAKGIASVCKMGQAAGIDVIPVDIGISHVAEHENLLKKKVAKGTRNFRKEPAMSKEQMWQAIQTGADLVWEYSRKGYKIFATGEMGIGNTTTSAAMASARLHMPVDQVTGRGAGLSDAGLRRKIEVIRQALEKYGLSGEADSGLTHDGIQDVETAAREQSAFAAKVLQCVGGFDIAGLVGVYLGGALYHIPIVLDGMISTVAALCAEKMFPGTVEYMIPSHTSKEPAACKMMEELKLSPMIDGNLSLGEGTGAVLLFPMLDMALRVYHGNTTFADIQVEQYERYGV